MREVLILCVMLGYCRREWSYGWSCGECLCHRRSQIVNPNIILVKILQLSWWTGCLIELAHQDNYCKNDQFNVGIYMQKALYCVTSSNNVLRLSCTTCAVRVISSR